MSKMRKIMVEILNTAFEEYGDFGVLPEWCLDCWNFDECKKDNVQKNCFCWIPYDD